MSVINRHAKCIDHGFVSNLAVSVSFIINVLLLLVVRKNRTWLAYTTRIFYHITVGKVIPIVIYTINILVIIIFLLW